MKRFSIPLMILASLLVLFSSARSQAAGRETAQVITAREVLQEIMAMPDQTIPENLLRESYGVAVIPGVIKAGFVVGGRYGTGILVVKKADGTWSNPSFITLAGGSFGWQAGAQSTDVVLVFKTRRSVEAIQQARVTLGGQASVAAGPVGRTAEASTSPMLNAEILSYSRSRGLFAGVSLEGAVLQTDHKSNAAFYGRPGITPAAIFTGTKIKAPAVAKQFTCTLARYSLTRGQKCA